MERHRFPKHPLELSLIDSNYCLIKDFPFKLSENVVQDHQLVPSPRHNGYIAQLKMLNSLKRIFDEYNVAITHPPNISFKMLKAGSKTLKRNQTSKINDDFGQWKLMQNQKKAISFFLQNECKIALGDGWGMGKTVTSLACFNYVKVSTVLIICPKILLDHWLYHLQALNESLQKELQIKILDIQLEKIKLEESRSKTIYSLVTSEYYEQNSFSLDVFSGVIIDEFFYCNPVLFQQLCNVSHVVIIANIEDEKLCLTKHIIPHLNNKITEKQLDERYEKSISTNKEEYFKALYRHYLIRSSRFQYKIHSIFKKVIINYETIAQERQNQGKKSKKSPNRTEVFEEMYKVIGLSKVSHIIQYVKMLFNSQKIQVFLIVYVNDQVGVQLHRKFTNQSQFSVHFVEKGISFDEKIQVYICKLEQLASTKKQAPSNHRVIFSELYEFSQESFINEKASKILQFYHNIEYIVHEHNPIEDQLIVPSILYQDQKYETISSDENLTEEAQQPDNLNYSDGENPSNAINLEQLSQEIKTIIKEEQTTKKRKEKEKVMETAEKEKQIEEESIPAFEEESPRKRLKKLIVKLIPKISQLKK